MATIYFLKQLAQNKITDRHGKVIPFERCSESRGIIVVDDEKQSDLVADLKKYIADKKGGVSVIDEETYENLKKNHPFTPRAPLSSPKLFDPAADPFQKAPAQAAQEVGAVGVAEVAANAGAVRGAAGLGSRPVLKGKAVRTGRASQPTTAPEPSSEPAATTPTQTAGGEQSTSATNSGE